MATADGIARVTLNRPDRLNSFTAQMHEELRDALAKVRADASARVLLLTGAGRGFCAGQDLSDRAVAPGGAPVDLGASIENNYRPLVLALRSLPMPVVCAVNGVAAGAGANIALACDLVIAAKSASFIQAFCKIGLIPDSGGTYFLPRLVGTARAMGLAMLGDKLTAQQAADWGLIWKCVDDAELRAGGRRAARAVGAGADAGLWWPRGGAACVGACDARSAARPRARPAARAGQQRRLSRRRRGVPRQASAALHGQVAWPTRCRLPRKSASSAPAPWARASRRSPRRPAIASACSTPAWARRIGPRPSSAKRWPRWPRKARSTAPLPMPPVARIVAVHALGDLVSAKLVVEAIVEDLNVKRNLFRELEVVVGARHDPRHEHVVAVDHGAGRGHEAPGPRSRHALLQSGAADAAGRGGQRPRDRRGSRQRDPRHRARLGQDAGPRAIDARLHRQSLRAAVLCRGAARPRRARRRSGDARCHHARGRRLSHGPVRTDGLDRPRHQRRGDAQRVGGVLPRCALHAVGAAAGDGRGRLSGRKAGRGFYDYADGCGQAAAVHRGPQPPSRRKIARHGELRMGGGTCRAHGGGGHRESTRRSPMRAFRRARCASTTRRGSSPAMAARRRPSPRPPACAMS